MPDRRTLRTRRQLRDALMALILEKGYDGVTIEDITERADLGRTTFYLHYRDKEGLLMESLDAIAEDLKEQIKTQVELNERGAAPPVQPIALTFRHAHENADLYRIILSGQGATRVASRLRLIIMEAVLEILSVRLKRANLVLQSDISLEVTAGYFAGAMLGFMTWWLEEKIPATPDEMADTFMRLFFEGARRSLGLPE